MWGRNTHHPNSSRIGEYGTRLTSCLATRYSVTWQWPLPREQCEVIDAFFAEQAKSGMVRESKSPHSTPTFCVRKPNGKWRMVHAYNKPNNSTVPAQTPIPRMDVLLNNMSVCTLYSALDLVDRYYQILMRESVTPLTAVSTPSGMLWEWLVMPPGLSNGPATFNRLVTHLFSVAQTYFDDIFVHSRAEDGPTTVEVHLKHIRRVIEALQSNKLYANIDRVGVRADPGKVKAIAVWPTPKSQKDLRKWLGLANYLHKYSAEYAELARPLSDLLKNDVDWVWEQQHQNGFDSIKASLKRAPVLALPDETTNCRKPMNLDFVFGLPANDKGNNGILVFLCRLSKMHWGASVLKRLRPVLLHTKNLPLNVVSSVGSNKLKHHYIGPFAGLARHDTAYTIDLPKSTATHPTFYVVRLKRYYDPLGLLLGRKKA
ncbi:Reverse transcriptase [Phytophthora palmivora]|uniref:Reverse transcriptase n=1 Tax=Phytophthora palmivora TaxID=4796 RepID=A0A2P4XDA4_9STRA|nr:Reverse transcriptase [Phytophthora palmivora]